MTGPRPVGVRPVLLVAVAAAALGYLLTRLWLDTGRGYRPSWLELAALLLIGGTAVVLGRRVRRMARGLPGPRVTPLTAARTFALAQASAVTGGGLAGAHAGSALALWPIAAATGGWSHLAVAVVLAVAAAGVAVIGLVVQGWCKRPDPPAQDVEADADDDADRA